MKRIAFVIGLLALSAPTFAQIDDVINKVTYDEHGEEIKRLSFIKRLFSEIQISNLVDDMKRDGVSERKFQGVLSIDGRFIDISTKEESNEKLKLAPFNVKITSDNKLQLSVALVDIGSIIPDNQGKVQFLVYKMDQGVEFRDIKFVGLSFVDTNFELKPKLTKTKSLVVDIGLEMGVGKETIRLDDGQEISLNRMYDSSYRWEGENVWYWDNKPVWTNYRDAEGIDYGKATYARISAGLGYESVMRNKNVMKVKTTFNYSRMSGSPEGQGGLQYQHERMMLNPEASYKFKTGRKTSLTLGAGMNIMIRDRIRETESDTDINLGNRSRQPYQASLKFNF